MIGISVKLALTYRLNALVRSFYALAYYVLIFATTSVVISQIENLGGWSKPELWILFGVTTTVNAAMYVLHFHSFRFIMEQGVRFGEIDQYITKPINTRFLLTSAKPHPDEILYVLAASIICVWFGWQARASITLVSLGQFLVIMGLVWGLLYYWLTIMTATSFFVTKTDQIIEVYDKSSDLAHYPASLFPDSVYIGLLVVLPIAFIGYVPTTFLVGKGSWQLALLTAGVFLTFRWLANLTWTEGMKRYGSASS